MELNQNLSHLSTDELLSYIDKHCTDPIVLRLARALAETKGSLVTDLEAAGMDSETWLFENSYYAGQYITKLENEIDYLNNEIHDLQTKNDELSNRSIVDFLASIKLDITSLNQRISQLSRDRDAAEDKAADALRKLDMWAVMNKNFQ